MRYRGLLENDTLALSIYDPMKYFPDKFMVSFIRRHKAHFPAPVKANEEDDTGYDLIAKHSDNTLCYQIVPTLVKFVVIFILE